MASISINPITGDDIINFDESTQTITISGTTSNWTGGAPVGNHVTIAIKDTLTNTVLFTSSTAQLVAGGGWSLSGIDLTGLFVDNTDDRYEVTASVRTTAGDIGGTASSTDTLAIDEQADRDAALTLSSSSGHVKNGSVSVSLSGIDNDIASGAITLSDGHGNTATYTLSPTDISSGSTITLDVGAFINFASLIDQSTITVTASVTDVAGNHATSSNSPTFILDNNADTGAALALAASGGHVQGGNVAVTLSGIDSDVASGTITLSDQHGHNATYALTGSDVSGGTTSTLHSSDFSNFANLVDQDTITASASVSDGAGNSASSNSPNFLLDNNADTGAALTLTTSSGHVRTGDVTVSLGGIDSDVASGTITLSDQHGHTAAYAVSGSDVSSGSTGALHSGNFTGFASLNDQDTITASVSVTDGAGNSASGNSPNFLLDNNADIGAALALGTSAGHVQSGNVTVSLSGIDSDVASGTITLTDQHSHSATYTLSAGDAASGHTGTLHASDFADFASLSDQDVIAASASVTDGVGNSASSNSPNFTLDNVADLSPAATIALDDSLINASESHSTAFTVAGLDADATAVATFTDHNGALLTAAVSADGTYQVDLHTLADGPITPSLAITDGAGNTASSSGAAATLDTTADGSTAATIALDDSLINATESSDTTFTVAGLDADAAATATFTDGLGGHVTVSNVTSDGNYHVDLSTLADGPITPSLAITDAAGNTQARTGTAATLDTNADAGAHASLVIGTPGGADEYVVDTHSVSFTIAELDSDAHGVVTFHDGIHADVQVTIPLNGNGAYNNIDLSSLSGHITSSLSITDAAGNTAGATGNEVYSTIQSAVDAATAHDTIGVAAGTYHETVTVDKTVTIDGANVGVAGTGSRGGESVVDAFYVTGANVTIDGVKVVGVENNNGEEAGIMIAGTADSFTLQNSVIARDPGLPPGHDGSFGFTTIYGQQNDHLTLTDNAFSGWDAGAYLQGGVTLSDASLTGNGFDGTSLISDANLDPTSNVSGNSFTNGAGIGYGSPESENVGAVIGANTFDTTPGVEIDYYVTANGQSDAGTVNADQMLGTVYWNGSTTNLNQTFEGGAGDDLIYGGGGTDTAHYTAAVSAASLTAQNVTVPAGIINGDATPDIVAGWQIATGGGEGTDKLVDVEIVDGSEPGKILLVGNGGFDTIQAAINAASAGDTILIAAGTYHENVTVNVSNLTIEGLGTVKIAGTFKSDNGISDGGVADFLESGHAYTQTAGRGFDILANNVTIQNVGIDGFTYGVNLGDGTSGTNLNNLTITDSLVGIKKGTTASISNLHVNGGSISDGLMGVDFDKSTAIGNQLVGTADGVTIDGTDFSNLSYKGIYVEALSHAHLTNIDMNDVGQFGAPSTSGTTGSGGDGIDLNLKNGSYSNIEIDNFHLTDTGASDQGNQGAHPIGQQNGGAIVVEARDFGSYLNVPGLITDTVSIHDGTINGHTSTGIQVGEPGQSNLDGPAVNIANVAISGAEHNSGHGDIANVTAATTTMTLLDAGQTVNTSPTSTGAIVINSGAGNDTILGHNELDSVHYDQLLTAASFSFDDGLNEFVVHGTAGVEGTDHLGVDLVTDNAGHRFLLVGNGGFSSVASAVTAASAGDTIIVAPGTYSGFVNIDKAVTILGIENAGIPGNGGVRGAESVLTGGVRISHDGVTLDGLKIAGTYDSQTQDGTDIDNGLLIAGSNATIQNSILDGAGLGDVRPFSTYGGGISGLDFNHNQVGNWGEGAYIVASSSGSIDHSDFHNNGNDILTESTSIVVSNSTFEDSAGSHIGILSFGQNVDASAVVLASNTFSNDHPRPVTIYPNDQNSETVDVTGTAFGDTFRARDNNGDHGLSNGPFNLSGGGGDDVYFVSSGDTVVESSGGGADEVRTTTSFTLPANVENLTLLDGATNTQTFDDMTAGAITNGENGWTVNGPNAPRDQEIVDVGGGNHVFRMSSDPAVADFAGPYSPALDASAGEPDTGAAYSSQTISYEFQPVNPVPDGSRLEVDFGNAAGTDRNNFLVIESFGSGIRIAVSEPDLSGNFSGDGSSAPPNDWRQLVSGVDPTVAHTLQMRLTYVDGQNNDVIGIYLDGKYIGQTTTFENYHDGAVVSDATHIANAQLNLTDRVFFRPSANGAHNDGPGGDDAGFYFDNITNSVYNGNNNTNGTGNGDANIITGNDGDNTLTGLGGDDTLVGGYGVDTAHYNGTLATSNFSFDSGANQWTVNATGIGEGTDRLSGIEVVTDTAGHKFLLLNGGSEFHTTQQAFDSDANAGHTGIIMDGSADVPPATTLSVNDTADHVINNSEAFNVSYTVAGLDPDATATLTFSDGSHPNVAVAVSANGTFNNANLSTLNGTVHSTLHITDSAGNTANVGGNDVTLDTTADEAPALTLIIPDTTINAAEHTHVSFSVSGLDPDTVTASVTFTSSGGGTPVVAPISGDGDYLVDLTGLGDGTVSSVLGVTDSHSNIASANGAPITLDTIAPAIAIDPVATDDTVNASEAAAGFSISGTESGADGQTVTVNILDHLSQVVDSYTTTAGSGAWSVNVTATQAQALANGSYTVTADVSDAVGNPATEATRSISVDETAPTVTVTIDDHEVNASETTTVHFTFSEPVTGFDPSSADVTVAGGALSNFQSADAAHWTATFTPGASTETTHAAVSVVAGSYTDAALNPGGAGSTGDFTVDTVAPTISIDTPIAGDDKINLNEATSGFAISGTTTDVEDGQEVTVNIDSSLHTYLATVTNNIWSVNVADGTSIADGPHTVTADVSDHAGNATAQVASHGITVDETPPTAPSVITLVLADDGSGGASLDLTGGTDNGTTVDVAGAGSGTLFTDQDSWGDTVDPLAAGSHHIVVTAHDTADNTTSTAFDVNLVDSTHVTIDLSSIAVGVGLVLTNGLPTGTDVTVFGSSAGGDGIQTGDGNDHITTNGNSTVYAGAGDDVLNGTANETFYGEAGNDTITFADLNSMAGYVGDYDPSAGSSDRDYTLERTGANTWVVTALTGVGHNETDIGADTVTGADSLQFDGSSAIVTGDLITLLQDTDGATDSVDENSGSGTPVGITAHAGDILGLVHYSLVNDDGGRFAIDAGTGEIDTGANNINREVDGSTRQVIVKATADDGSFTQHAYTINIGDVNDNAPAFTSGTTASEAENTATTNVVYDANATDADVTTANNTIAFSLSGDDAALFSINSTTGEVRFLSSPNAEAPADADHNNQYQVTVHANDGLHDTTQDVTISVTDVNDNAPVFTSGTTAAEAENTATTNVVYDANATDADVTPANNTIAFSLSGDDAALFLINSTSGEVRFLTSPNAEAPADADHNNQYQVTVHANDGLHDTTQDVTIAVTDVNDNAPVFTSGTTGTEAENTATTNVVYDANATDADVTPANNTIAFSLSGDDAALFSINSTSGEVRFLTSPNAEAPADADHNNQYQVTVHASDGLHDTTQDVTISVTDVNDNAPVFTSGTTAAEAENTATTNVVYDANATDADVTTANNTIAFSLSGDDAALFSINSTSGEVRFLTSPNAEAPADADHNNQYQVTVHANDGLHDTTQDVTISVTDVNDNAPAFTSGTTGTEVENTATTNVVYDANATDADVTTANNTIAFSLSGDDAALFSINSTTGEVRFLSSPNAEAPADADHNNQYQVTVHANDGLHDTTQDVTISVTDVNDNAPVFTSGTTAAEAENTATTNVVYDANATDADVTTANNTIAFSLSGDDAALFSINSTTGEVRFLSSPNAEAPADADHNNQYQVTVHANDGLHDTTQDVTISVTDVNDNAPVFTSGTTAAEAENTATTNVVYDANATDADVTPANNTIAFSLSGDDAALFSINSTSGEVRFLTSPNAEAPADADHNNQYQVTVHANDGLHDTTQDVTIAVTDVNDNAPVIQTNTAVHFHVGENSAGGTAVGTVLATDADATAPNNVVAYSIISGTGFGKFDIHASGAISVHSGAVLDFETTSTYTVDVKAQDGGTPTLFDTKTFTIDLTDVNEAPVVTGGQTFSPNENVQSVGTVVATDQDSVASGFHSIKYTLDSNTNDNNLFAIDQITGALSFASAAGSDGADPLGSHGPDYVVDVRVSDASTPALTTHQTVAVHAASIGAITNNGTTGNDTEYGTQSGDTLNGNAGNDTIYGGAGADNMDGGSGNDTLYGGVGIDTINGGAGNDKIYGGAGADALTGGSGADQFIFNTASEGTDTITDFLSANSSLADKIALDKAGFGITTQTSSDLFTNSALSFHDGGLWWNGINGTDPGIELAIVQHITHMSGTDILLV